MKKNLLLYSYAFKRIEDLVQFANNIRGEFNLFFIISTDDCTEILEVNNYEYISLDYKNKNEFSRTIIWRIYQNIFFKKMMMLIQHNSIGQILNQKMLEHQYTYSSNILKKIIKDKKIDLIIMLLDRSVQYISVGLLKASKDLNIPIFLPYFMNLSKESTYQVIKGNRKYTISSNSSYYQKKIFKKYKDQTYKETYFFSSFIYVAFENLGILHKIPWLSGSFINTYSALPNKKIYDERIKEKIPLEKVKILGDISYFSLYDIFINKEENKKKIRSKYNILENKKIMIVGLANWWEHDFCDKETHFEIVEYTIRAACEFKNEYAILISLHPSMKKENYIYLEKKFMVTLLETKLMNVLPVADFYLADQSSTIIWSTLCKIKTLIISCYLDMKFYDYLSSFSKVNKKENIVQEIKKMIKKDIYYENDFKLLSRDIVFNGEIKNNYIDMLKKLSNLK